MPRTRRIALAVVLLGAALWLVRSSCGDRQSSHSTSAAPQRARPAQDGPRSRVHKDVNKLARALSLVAGQTMGLVRIEGRVLEKETGDAIPEAEVFFTGPSGESSTLCDAEGRFNLEILPGFYRSYAQARGYIAAAPAAAERIPKQDLAGAVAMPRAMIAPLAGFFRNHRAVELHLSAGATLQVTVSDQAGTPITGVAVAAVSNKGLQLLSGADVGETDGNGEVHLLLPVGVNFLRAEHEDYAGTSSPTRMLLQKGEDAVTTMVLEKGCIIEGTVMHTSGTPALEGALEKRQGPHYVPVGEIRSGRVRYTQLHEGPLTLRAWPWKSPPSASKEYECTQGAAWKNEVFSVPDAQPVLTGQVTGPDGEPTPLAFVDVFPLQPGVSGQQERSDAQGEFEFFELAAGPYQVSVFVPGKGALVRLIDVPSTGVPLQLGGTGTLIGQVEWLERGSLTMRYRCDFGGQGEHATQSDAVSMPMQTTLVLVEHHRFRIDDVPACPISGSVTSPDRMETFSLEVRSGQDTPLLLQ